MTLPANPGEFVTVNGERWICETVAVSQPQPVHLRNSDGEITGSYYNPYGTEITIRLRSAPCTANIDPPQSPVTNRVAEPVKAAKEFGQIARRIK